MERLQSANTKPIKIIKLLVTKVTLVLVFYYSFLLFILIVGKKPNRLHTDTVMSMKVILAYSFLENWADLD